MLDQENSIKCKVNNNKRPCHGGLSSTPRDMYLAQSLWIRFLTVERGILNLHTSGVFALRDANEVSHGCEGICKTELIY